MTIHRRRSAMIAGMTALLLGGAATAWAATDTPWAQSDADASHSRSNATETTLSAVNVGTVQYRRSIVSPPAAGGSADCAGGTVGTASAIVGGHLYAVVSDHLKAYTIATGALLWDRPLDTSSTSVYKSVSVAGSRIVVSALDCISQSDPSGVLWAVSTSTGALLWTAPSQVSGGEGSLDQTVVSGAYVVTASSGAASSEPFVAVRNIATGTAVWDRTTCGQPSPATALVVAGKVVYTTCDLTTGAGQHLVAATLATGAVSWSRAVSWTPEIGDTDSASSSHHLYVKTSTGVTDLNPATGATRYSIAGATAAVADDAVRVYTKCSAGICAYTRSTGAFLWSADAGVPVAVANGVVYEADGSALRATTGAVLATLWGGPAATSISVGDGYVAAQTDPRIIDVYGLPGS